MRLLIRATDIAWTSVGLSDNGRVKTSRRIDTRPETILNAVLAFLKEEKTDLQALDSIGVVRGRGSFTSLRNSLTFVNAVHYVRDLPTVGVVAARTEGDRTVFARLARARASRKTLHPSYGQKAMITKPKK
jgi:tRNA A37 threonylcarbamoyladenosine modification protein TsaB